MTRILQQIITGVSSLAVALSPILAAPSFGQGISGAGANAPEVLRSANNTPLVMIETPNDGGVSHNTYDSFDIDNRGAILNNIDNNYGRTQLGGYVQGNDRLTNGPASVIINEVITNNPSELGGYLEVGGTRADVVIANPYGITCDGCGFINTDRATITTGTPELGSDGSLNAIDVNRGHVKIGKRGLDATGVSQFDLLSRTVEFAGVINGKNIRVIAGRNNVIYATGEVTVKGDDGGEAPAIAIDSTVLGGMYANKITINSTERGVGVRAPETMAANAGEMHITADGRLVMGTASAKRVVATSRNSDVEIRKQIAAAERAEVNAARDLVIAANGQLVSDAALSVKTGRDVVLQNGASAGSQQAGVKINAGGTVDLGASAQLISAQDLNLQSQRLNLGSKALVAAGGAGRVTSKAVTLNGGTVQTTGDLSLTGGAIQIADGTVQSGKNLSVTATGISGANHSLSANGSLNLTAGTVALGEGRIVAGGDAVLRADSFAAGGVIGSQDGTLEITTTSGDLRASGTLSAAKNIRVSSAGQAGLGHVQAGEVLSITAAGDVTGLDAFTSGGVMEITTGGSLRGLALHAGVDVVANASGDILVGDNPETAGNLLPHQEAAGGDGEGDPAAPEPGETDNTETAPPSIADAGETGGDDFTITPGLRIGDVRAGRDIDLTAGGRIVIGNSAVAERDISLDAGKLIDISALQLGGALSMQSGTGDTRIGTLAVTGDFALDVDGKLALDQVASPGSLTLTAGRLSLGGAAAGTDLVLTAENGDLVASGNLLANGRITLDAAGSTKAGQIVAKAVIDVTAGKDFAAKTVQSDSTVKIDAGGKLTSEGLIDGDQGVTLISGGQLSGTAVQALQGGVDIDAGGDATLTDAVISAAATDIASTGALVLNNLQSGAELELTSAKDARVNGNLTAKNKVIANIGGRFELAAARTAETGTLLIGGESVDITAQSLHLGDYAQLSSGAGELTFRITETSRIDHQSGILAADSLNIASGTLMMMSGSVVSAGGLADITLDRLNVNDAVLQSQSNLTLQSGATVIAGSKIQAGGNLSLFAADLSGQDNVISAAGTLDLKAGTIALKEGQIAAGRDATIRADGLTIQSTITSQNGGVFLTTEKAGLDFGGRLMAAGDIGITSAEAGRLRHIQAGGALAITTAGDITGLDAFQSAGNMTIMTGGTLRGLALHSGSDVVAQAKNDILIGDAPDTAGALLPYQLAAMQNNTGAPDGETAGSAQSTSLPTPDADSSAHEQVGEPLPILSDAPEDSAANTPLKGLRIGDVRAGKNIDLTAGGRIFIANTAISSGDMVLSAGELAEIATLRAGETLAINSPTGAARFGQVTTAGDVTGGMTGAFTAETLSAGGDIALTAGGFDLGGVAAGSDVTLTSRRSDIILNGDLLAQGQAGLKAAGAISAGRIVSGTDMALSSGTKFGADLVQAGNNLTIRSGSDLSVSELITAKQNVTLNSDGDFRAASVQAQNGAAIITVAGDAKVSNAVISGTKTQISSGGTLTLNNLQAGAALVLGATRDLRLNGTAAADGTLTATTDGQFVLAGAKTADQGRRVIANGNVSINAAGLQLGNYSQLASKTGDVTLRNRGASKLGNGATIVSTKALALTGTGLTLSQDAALQGQTLSLDLSQTLTLSEAAQITGQTGFDLKAGSLTLAAGALISQQTSGAGQKPMSITVSGKLSSTGGIIQSGGALSVKAAEIALLTTAQDRRAAVLADGNLNVTAAKVTAGSKDLLQSNTGALILNGQNGAVDATGGIWRAAQTLEVTSGRIALQNSDLGTAGALTLDATTGDLTFLNGTANAAALTLKAAKNATISGRLASSGAIRLEARAGDLSHSAQVTTPKTLTLLAGNNVTDTGRGILPAGAGQNAAHLGALSMTGGSVDSRGNYLVAGTTNITSQTGGVSTTGRIVSGAALKVIAAAAMLNSGTLEANSLTLNADRITNSGNLTGAGNLVLTATQQGITNNGAITAGKTLTLDAKTAIENQSKGVISAHYDTATIKAASLSNAGTIGLTAARFKLAGDLRNSGTLSANTTGTIGGTLINTGEIKGGNHVLKLANLNNSGNFRTDRSITLTMSGSDIDNSGLLHGGQGVTINKAAAITNTATGEISGNRVILNGQSLSNAGDIIADLTRIDIANRLSNSGLIQSGALVDKNGGSWLRADTISNSGDIIADQGKLTLTARKTFANTGKVSGRGANSYLAIHADDMNKLGQIASEGTLELANVTGGLLSALDVEQGENIVTEGALIIKAKKITNAGGIAGLGGLTLEGNSLTNKGTIYSEADMALRFRDLVDNDGGYILAIENMTVSGRESGKALTGLTNQHGGTIETVKGDMSFNIKTLENLRRYTTVTAESYSDLHLGGVSNNRGSWSFCYETGVGCDSHREPGIEQDIKIDQFRIKSDFLSIEFADKNASRILSGGDISFIGGDILNQFSQISAANNIEFKVKSVTNIGSGTGERVQIAFSFNHGLDDGRGGNSSDANNQHIARYGKPINEIDYYARAFGLKAGDVYDAANYSSKGGILGILDDDNGLTYGKERGDRDYSTFSGPKTGVRLLVLDSTAVLQHSGYGSLDLRNLSNFTDDKSFTGGDAQKGIGYLEGGKLNFVRRDWASYSTTGFIGANAEYGTIHAGGKIIGDVSGYVTNESVGGGIVYRPGNDRDFTVTASASTRHSSTGGPLIGGGTVVTASMLSFTPEGAGKVEAGALAQAVAAGTVRGLQGQSGLSLFGRSGETVQITGPAGPAGASLPGQTDTTFFGRAIKTIIAGGQDIRLGSGQQSLIAQNNPNAPSLSGGGFVNLGAIGNDNLFVVNQKPGSGYLVETRHEFIDQNNFLSSDYFLDSLGFDPERKRMRLGDAMVETWLIRDQLFEQTGRNLLVGQGSEYDQLRSMYDNAADQARALGLVPGVSLTASQVKALTSDIVWLEERTVSGRKVLIPRVYLTAKTIRNNAKAAAYIGGDKGTNLKTGKLINIGGAIGSTQGQTVIASNSDIQNDYGLIFGGKNSASNANGLKLPSVVLSAKGNYTSTSGLVTGKDIVIQATDILIKTDIGNDPIAAIRAANDINLNAIRDITLKGAKLTSGGNVAALAGGDITLGAIRTEANAGNTSGRNYHFERRVGHITSDITAGGNISLISTGTNLGGDGVANVTLYGSDVNAGGSVGIAAMKGDVNLLSVIDEHYTKSGSDIVSGGNTPFGTNFHAPKRIERNYSSTNELSHNTASITGGNINIYAKNNVTAQGTVFKTTDLVRQATVDNGSLRITAADGDINFTAVENSYSREQGQSTQINGTLISSSGSSMTTPLSIQAVTTNTTGDVYFDAGRDITSAGAQIESGGNVSMRAGGDITLDVAAQTTKTSSNSQGYSASTSQIRNQTSDIRAAGNIALISTGTKSGDDGQANVTLIGSDLKAGAKIGIVAQNGDVSFKAATDEFQTAKAVAGRSLLGSFIKLPGYQTSDKNLSYNTTTLSGAEIAIFAAGDITGNASDWVSREDITAVAGGNITLNAIAIETESGSRGGSNYNYERNLTHLTSSITAGGNVALISTGEKPGKGGRANVTLYGSDVNAGGSVGIAAMKGNVNLLSVVDEHYTESARKKKSLFKKKTYFDAVEKKTHRLTSLSGSEIDIYAKGNVTAVGTQFTADGLSGKDAVASGDLRITAETGNIDFRAAENTLTEKHEKSSKLFGGLFSSSSSKKSALSDMQGVVTKTTGDLDLSAVQGSVLFQGGDYTGVAGKVNVDAKETYLQGTIDSQYSFEHSNDNNGFVITDKTRVTVNETAEAPLFNQGALSINGDVHVGGRDGAAQLVRGSQIESLGPQGILAAQNAGKDEGSGKASGDAASPHWTQNFTEQYGSDAQTRQVALADVTGPGTEYLRELDTTATGDVTYGAKAELLDVQYQEVTKQTGVLTKAIIAVATQGMGTWATFAVNTAVDGIISGEINLENIAKDAAFTFATAGFDTLNPEGFQGVTGEFTQNLQLSSAGFAGSDYFSQQWLATSAVDAGVTGAAQTVLYGGNLGDNIARDFANSTVNESTAALFNGIGNVKQTHNLADGSLPGAIMKGAAGCLSSEASGGTCASGFIVSVSNEFASPFYGDGYVEDPNATAQEKERARKTYELDRAYNLGVVTGALTSGGDVSNIGRGSGITTSAIQNNRQLHVKEAELIELYANEYAVERGYCATETSCTDDALIRAKSELAEETLRGVSDDFARVEENAQARGFLNSLNIAGDTVDDQTMFGELDENSDEYRNSLINIGNVVNTPDIYNNLASVQNFAGESGQTYVFDRAGQEQHRYFQDAGRAETLAYFDGIEKTLTNLSGEREELRKKILSAVAKDEDPSALLDQDVTLALHMQGLMDSGTEAVFYASRAGTLTNDELSGDGFIAELRYGSLTSVDFSPSGASATSVRGTAKWFGKKAPKGTLTFTETGTGTHLRRTVDVDGQVVQLNSGHSYNRTHSGGDVRDSGLSMDQIDNAIVNDIAANVNVGSLPQVPQMTSNTININGYSLTYDVTRLPDGNVSVSTYYPGP